MRENHVEIIATLNLGDGDVPISYLAENLDQLPKEGDNSIFILDNFELGAVYLYVNGDKEFWWDTRSYPFFAIWWMDNYREFVSDETIYLQVSEGCLLFKCFSSHIVLHDATDPGWIGWLPFQRRVLQHGESFVLKPQSHNGWPLGVEIVQEVSMSHNEWFRSMVKFTSDYRKLLLAIKEGVYKNTDNFYYEDFAENIEHAYKFCDEYPKYEREIKQFMAENDIA